ncbi:UDP-N-acetylglucosamine 1-carboxyvinyltransferase [Kyrpidia spormannii]|uniref:UDP-N-acetylglucosamine 1-carboxyvinyltransferase n=1 Tax=Kyrpidia spormannii TaxID=2055160 RepID=A0A2K8NBI7_9BACL|nr:MULTISPECIES: UDP-N-acetylglucosamine 1-carboxyvinyltransferase [Kyrpidia]ATY86475.1 UDP-N-acetylglucosamine 1-carboxyvinyltransferase [Kyrpidia spormannii]MCL6575480.1 UDP-N-acetylglucosamine 1-carboxyvinyltransferase [Kyrpidia sp.]
MDRIAVEGGTPLEGTVRVHGAKNAALPILAATLLAEGVCVVEDVPDLQDIRVMVDILRALGASVDYSPPVVRVDARRISRTEVPEELMRQMRSSIFLMGPLLARYCHARVSRPGGCTIGSRPIDLHLKGLAALGASIDEVHGYIDCQTRRLHGAAIYLDTPSVGATENLMMAAVLAEGTTVIGNAAREPEIVDLANFLNRLGARVEGAGEDTLVISGVQGLIGGRYAIIPDRIVAGTLAIAVSMTGGDVTLENVRPNHLGAVLTKLREGGVEIETGRDIMRVRSDGKLRAVEQVRTAPYPGFPTDLQAPFMALLSVAPGMSIVAETVFEERFKHVSELCRMGANIRVDLRTAFVQGVPRLTGAVVQASDLRAGAALVLAGLVAEGTTVVEQAHHIDRGYQQFDEMLRGLGARVRRLSQS